MADAYTRAIKYFKANPDRIEKEWNNAGDSKNNPYGFLLFGGCSLDREMSYGIGCLSQVKSGAYLAATDELTDLIRATPNLPEGTGLSKPNIHSGNIGLFATLNRKIDMPNETTCPTSSSLIVH